MVSTIHRGFEYTPASARITPLPYIQPIQIQMTMKVGQQQNINDGRWFWHSYIAAI
jgi:hypothetical protein